MSGELCEEGGPVCSSTEQAGKTTYQGEPAVIVLEKEIECEFSLLVPYFPQVHC